KTHTARLEFQRNAVEQDNLGVGDYDLPSRGYSQNQTEEIARLADSGVFGKRVFNELRFQARWFENEARSYTAGQTIMVPGSFNLGSAQRFGGRRQVETELDDNIDYATKHHAVRFGLQFEAGHYRSNDSVNHFGTFTFASVADFEAGKPLQYT